MPTQNSSDNKFTNNSDGFDLAGGSTARKLTLTGADVTVTGSGTNTYTYPTATTTLVGTDTPQSITNKAVSSTLLHDYTATVVNLSLPAGHNYNVAGGLTIGSGQGITLTSSSVFTCTPNIDFPSLWQSGDIKQIAYAQPDPGWLLCDGSAVSRSTYAVLFGKIGTTWGVGDGSTTFNVPDFRGRMPIGAGTGTASGATSQTLGSIPTSGAGGEQTHTMTTGEMVAHTHGMGTRSVYPPTGAAQVYDPNGAINNTTQSTGTTTPFNILPPIAVVNFVIKI